MMTNKATPHKRLNDVEVHNYVCYRTILINEQNIYHIYEKEDEV